MGLAGLWNAPTNPSDLSQWSLDNAAHHADILQFIFQKFNPSGRPRGPTDPGLVLSSYVIDPMDPNSDVWMYQHQVMHQQMDAVLGIAGYDLTEVDWRDPEDVAAWIQAHASEHVQANTKLGIP